ncbi:TonB-dependent receptor [Novosphingobium sp. FSY-8]|uniref:TonB-dependent receptor n=1 Tax=Novosphingobium ovatum TaxID=1908523 RepID=A0ABW9XH39_9SPHN|nr:TonB-dependent receptor [Novosphingobium ovatum]NBC37874.1 TonB-dependent receptor [Novosphingobium ovatum]
MSPAHAIAQTAQPEATGGLTEIVVTAEKRESTAQKTPIAMTVATGAQLAQAGVSDVNGLSNIAPTLNVAQNNQNTLITIRGVSSRDYTETGNPAVAISTDNFYLQNGTALNVGFFDLDRIEVLRGPQGTLYGRNATAGAINIQTAKPKKRTEGSMTAGFGYKNALLVEGMLNTGITDNLFVRGSFSVHQRDAYRDNGSLSSANSGLVTRGGNDDVSQAARLHLLWEPTTNFSALVTGEYTHVGGVGAVQKGILYGNENADGTLKLGDTKSWNLNTQGFIDLTIKNIRGTLKYDLNGASITYIGGFRTQHLRRQNDQDGSTAYNYGFPTDGSTETQNHELRIASNNDSPFAWQGGLYYFREGGYALTYFQVLGGATPFNYYTFSYDTNAKSFAGFGQVSYKLTETLKLSAGARYTDERKSQIGFNNIAGTYSVINQHYSGSKDTYHLGLDWQATRTNLVYAKFDTGFKSGGFQNGYTYGPETIRAFEIGTKNRFLDNHLELNVDGFWYDYSSLQVQQNDPVTAISRIFNAGKARVYGIEAEASFAITPTDRIDANINWVHGRYLDFLNNGTQYAGNTLPQSPEWAYGGGYSHDFLLPDAKITARVQTRFQTKSYFGFENRNYQLQKAYTKTDLILSYTPLGKGFSASAYVYNVENSTILTASDEAGYAGGYLVQFADPRTYGVRLSYSF